MDDFFISYNKADKLWAEGLANWLGQAFFTTILQQQDFVAGSNFVSGMHRSLKVAQPLSALLFGNQSIPWFPLSAFFAVKFQPANLV
jgi:hypothetical protein